MEAQAKIAEEFNRRKQFYVYTFIGVMGLSIDLGLFFLLFNFAHLDKSLANFISTTLAITNNFFWNLQFNFKSKGRISLRFLSFYAVGIVGLLITQGLLIVFSDVLKINPNVVKVGSLIIVLLVQFNLNRLITFRSQTEI